DAAITEGNSGTVNESFAVTLSLSSSQIVTVNWATADGTATAPSDYTAGSGSLTFNPGETSKSVAVPVNGDTTYEPDEGFLLNLSNASGATISDAQGIGGISNDDPLPTISVNDVSKLEGNSGTTGFDFTVSLSNPSYQLVSVNYGTQN